MKSYSLCICTALSTNDGIYLVLFLDLFLLLSL